MSLATGNFTIVSYRDFYDVPRLLLAVDEASNYWIFDCAFDDKSDNYPPNYNIYFAAKELKEAQESIALYMEEAKLPLAGVVPIGALEFDQTKRCAFRLTAMPFRELETIRPTP